MNCVLLLNSIIGFSEVLQDELLGSLNASQIEDVEHIIKAGRHLLSLINDILDLSKVESGKMELEVETGAIKRNTRCNDGNARKRHCDMGLV